MNDEKFSRSMAAASMAAESAAAQVRNILQDSGLTAPEERYGAIQAAMGCKLLINPAEVVEYAALSLFRMVQDQEWKETIHPGEGESH